jgi:TonB family protein
MRMLYLSVSLLFALVQSTTVPAPPAAGSASSQPAPPASPAEGMTPKDAKERMDLARKVNGLQGLDIPWHLKASYEVFAADGKSSDTGTYEEWRVNAKQYRIALHGSSVSVEEYGTDHGVFRDSEQDWPGKPLSSIQNMVERPIFPERNPEKTVLQNYERSFGNQKLACTASMDRGARTTSQNSTSFCFSPNDAVLFYSGIANRKFETLFQHVSVVHGHYLANDMQRFVEGRLWLKIHVELLEGIGPAGLSALTIPTGASPVSVRVDVAGDVIGGHLVSKVVPMYPSAAKLQGVQGTVLLDGVIGKDGHFKTLQVLAGPQMLQQPAIDAVRQWTYKPYLLDGQPVEVETDVNVVFFLGR